MPPILSDGFGTLASSEYRRGHFRRLPGALWPAAFGVAKQLVMLLTATKCVIRFIIGWRL